MPPTLTSLSHGAGCGCKIGPGALAEVLATVVPVQHPDLLVGTETGDDAAVWRLDADRALVATTDFFTPVVDDARLWGRIAATNAVSDVYAMGGRPLFALNLVAWPTDQLSPELLGEVLAGGADAGRECGHGGSGVGARVRTWDLRPRRRSTGGCGCWLCWLKASVG